MIDGLRARTIRHGFYKFCRYLAEKNKLPQTWAHGIDPVSEDAYHRWMKSLFEECQLCQDNWFADEIAVRNLTTWRTRYLARQAKQASGAARTGQRKRRRVQPDSDDEDDSFVSGDVSRLLDQAQYQIPTGGPESDDLDTIPTTTPSLATIPSSDIDTDSSAPARLDGDLVVFSHGESNITSSMPSFPPVDVGASDRALASTHTTTLLAVATVAEQASGVTPASAEPAQPGERSLLPIDVVIPVNLPDPAPEAGPADLTSHATTPQAFLTDLQTHFAASPAEPMCETPSGACVAGVDRVAASPSPATMAPATRATSPSEDMLWMAPVTGSGLIMLVFLLATAEDYAVPRMDPAPATKSTSTARGTSLKEKRRLRSDCSQQAPVLESDPSPDAQGDAPWPPSSGSTIKEHCAVIWYRKSGGTQEEFDIWFDSQSNYAQKKYRDSNGEAIVKPRVVPRRREALYRRHNTSLELGKLRLQLSSHRLKPNHLRLKPGQYLREKENMTYLIDLTYPVRKPLTHDAAHETHCAQLAPPADDAQGDVLDVQAGLEGGGVGTRTMVMFNDFAVQNVSEAETLSIPSAWKASWGKAPKPRSRIIVEYLTEFSGNKFGNLDPSLSRVHVDAAQSAPVLLDDGCIFTGHGLSKDLEPSSTSGTVGYEADALSQDIFVPPEQAEAHCSIEDALLALKLFKVHLQL
ncbi:hypothetical protein C8Q80DRAFT_1274776 [Daedaleopsis nitida]|nr:hypothetical protein C8Q80DRAFT_1274776 [Daedaleopsis nitida]